MEQGHDIVGGDRGRVTAADAEPRRAIAVVEQRRAAVSTDPGRTLAGEDQERGTGRGEDARVAALRTAVAGLRRRLVLLPPDFPDRAVAEEELAALAAMTGRGVPELPRLHRSLLLVAGAVGSVSVLSRDLADVRRAVESLGTSPRR